MKNYLGKTEFGKLISIQKKGQVKKEASHHDEFMYTGIKL